jgi:hypothetical protein
MLLAIANEHSQRFDKACGIGTIEKSIAPNESAAIVQSSSGISGGPQLQVSGVSCSTF